MNENAKVVKTNDGSDTLFLPSLNEHYHSTHGARQESQHVYIVKGLDYFHQLHPKAESIRILEVGFGTGLNALLTCMYAQNHNVNVEYTSLEPYPIATDIVTSLNFNFSSEEEIIFNNIHEADWEQFISITDDFQVKKIRSSLEEFEAPECTFDIIYFDAFAPNKQKNIWGSGNFLKLFNVLTLNSGILTTYCAQGEFKRIARSVGFEVEETDGPPGKREMVRLKK